MADINTTTVLAAFEMLLEEVEHRIDCVNRAGSKAFAEGDYATVEMVHSQAIQLTAFREKAAQLRAEWTALSASLVLDNDETAESERRNLGRLKRGTRTPEEVFRPFLRAFANVDYAIARPFTLPERFDTRVQHPDGERIVPVVHVTYLHHRGGEAALFDEALEALQAELPANSDLRFGESPLVCITPLEWDGAERVWPSATKRTDL